MRNTSFDTSLYFHGYEKSYGHRSKAPELFFSEKTPLLEAMTKSIKMETNASLPNSMYEYATFAQSNKPIHSESRFWPKDKSLTTVCNQPLYQEFWFSYLVKNGTIIMRCDTILPKAECKQEKMKVVEIFMPVIQL